MQYKNDGIKYSNSKCLLSTASLAREVNELLKDAKMKWQTKEKPETKGCCYRMKVFK